MFIHLLHTWNSLRRYIRSCTSVSNNLHDLCLLPTCLLELTLKISHSSREHFHHFSNLIKLWQHDILSFLYSLNLLMQGFLFFFSLNFTGSGKTILSLLIRSLLFSLHTCCSSPYRTFNLTSISVKAWFLAFHIFNNRFWCLWRFFLWTKLFWFGLGELKLVLRWLSLMNS